MVSGELTKQVKWKTCSSSEVWGKGTEDTEGNGLCPTHGKALAAPAQILGPFPCQAEQTEFPGADWGCLQIRCKEFHPWREWQQWGWQTLPTVPLSQLLLRHRMDELRDVLGSLQTKTDLKGSQWLNYWWILMFYSKSKTRGKAERCRAGKAYLCAPLLATLPELQFEKGGGLCF